MELPWMWTKPNKMFPHHSKLYLRTTMFKNNEITFLKLSYILVPSFTGHYSVLFFFVFFVELPDLESESKRFIDL